MKALSDLQLFVRAAQATSLSDAARAMGMSPATASVAIKRLEAELGVPLFVRSTRNLRLTQEGEQFLDDCRMGLDLLLQAGERVAASQGDIHGVVQLSMPSDLGNHVVLPWLNEFRQRHPRVKLRLSVSDRVLDLTRHPVDIALRYGEPPDSSMVSLSVAPRNRRALCAAPDYLARHGRVSSPRELPRHDCLCFMLSDRSHNHWTFMRGAEIVEVDVQGSMQSDNGDTVRRMALMGEGIVYKSYLDVAADLRSGRLVRLCPDWQGELAPLNLISPGRQHLRPAIRALHEFLVERFAAMLAGEDRLTPPADCSGTLLTASGTP